MVARNCLDETLHPADLANEVAELPLLLPAWQLGALGQAAQAEGMTIAQLLRRMVNRTLEQQTLAEPGYYHG